MTEELYARALAAHAEAGRAQQAYDAAAEARGKAWAALVDAGQTYAAIGARFGVTRAAVFKVCSRYRATH
jgi:hypothetical protein